MRHKCINNIILLGIWYKIILRMGIENNPFFLDVMVANLLYRYYCLGLSLQRVCLDQEKPALSKDERADWKVLNGEFEINAV